MTLKGFLKGIVYASFAIIPMLAWYVSETTFFPYITGKNFSFRFLVEIAFVAWAILAVIEPAYRVKKSLVFYSYGAFLLILFVANIFGSDTYLSFFSNFERMEGWFTHLHLFLYFLMLYSVYKTDKDWLRMFGWFSVGAIGVSIQGLFQLFGQKEFFLTSAIFSTSTIQKLNDVYPVSMGNGLRLDSSLGNADYYGIYTLFFICISSLLAFKMNSWNIKGSLASWKSFLLVFLGGMMISLQPFITKFAININNESVYYFGSFLWLAGSVVFLSAGYYFAKNISEYRISSWVFVLIGVVNFIALIYTQTRGSWFGFVGAFGAAALCIAIGGRKKYPKLALGASLGIVSILAFFILVFTFSNSYLVQNSVILRRLATIKVVNILFHPVESVNLVKDETNDYESLKEHFGEATIVSRFLNIKMSIDGWSESNKTKIIGYGQENYPVVFAKHYDARMYDQEAYFDRAHNVFMDWLVAGGVLALIAYLSLYLTPFYMMWFGRGKNNFQLFEKAILTGTLVGYFVHNIFVFDNIISYIIFVSILAYIAVRTRATDSEIRKEESHKDILLGVMSYVMMAVGVIIAILLFVYTVIKPLNQNLALVTALRVNPSTVEDAFDNINTKLNAFNYSVSSNSFGVTEAREQLLKSVVPLVNIQTSNLQAETAAKLNVAVKEFKSFAETQFEKEISDSPTSRNTSVYASYLRQINETQRSLKFYEKSYEFSPRKQVNNIEYMSALVSTEDASNITRAYEIAKETYFSDTGHKASRDAYIAVAVISGHIKEAKDEVEKIKLTDPETAKSLEDNINAILAQQKINATKKK